MLSKKASHTQNMLHVKKKIRPEDYRRDAQCVIVDSKGVRHTFPTSLIIAIRAGLVEL